MSGIPNELCNKTMEERLEEIIDTLEERAEQLILDGRYKDAERIYNHVLGHPMTRIRFRCEDQIQNTMPKLVSVYEKMGNFSAAMLTQETLLHWVIQEAGPFFEVINCLAKEVDILKRLYSLFYHRIREMIVGYGVGQPEGTNIARRLVFCRTARLDLDPFNIAIVESHLIGVPEFALHAAINAGAINLTKILLKRPGCNVDSKDDFGETALHEAVRNRSSEIVQMLVDADADLEITNNQGETALLSACSVNIKGLEIFNILLDAGANAKAMSNNKDTALHLAVRYGNGDLVRLLLSKGVNVDAGGSCGETALMTAVGISNGVPIAQQLLQAGADWNAGYESKETLLRRAVRSGSAEMVRFLIDSGADVNTRGTNGGTALHEAFKISWYKAIEEVILVLIEGKVDIEAKNNDGDTVLDLAIKNAVRAYEAGNTWRYKILQAAAPVLIEHGAHIRPEDRALALWLVSEKGREHGSTKISGLQ